MKALALLRGRDPVAALAAALVLAAIVGGPRRDTIRMKDTSRPIVISLAPPPMAGEAKPEPATPTRAPPRPVAPSPRPVTPPHPRVMPRVVEPTPAPVTETVAPASAAAPAFPTPAAASAPSTPFAPPQPAAPAPVNVEATYVAKLRAYLESIKRYPTTREARSMRPQGSVRVWIELEREGTLHAAGIDASSGSMILDAAALATVRQGNYPPFPVQSWSGQATHRFEVTLEYSLAG